MDAARNKNLALLFVLGCIGKVLAVGLVLCRGNDDAPPSTIKKSLRSSPFDLFPVSVRQ